MRQIKWTGWVGAAALTLVAGTAAQAQIASDRAAALVNYPYIVVDGDEGVDTVLTLSNASHTDPVDVHCFYENANSHCTNDGTVCTDGSDCCDGLTCGLCVPGWNETDFNIRITPLQPIAWVAGDGLTLCTTDDPDERCFKIDGVDRTGIGGSSNAGSRIPPVPEDPFVGLLKCVAVDDAGTPIDSNVLHGTAAIEDDIEGLSVGKYNAVGFRAVDGAVNDDNELVLGGDNAEYEGCPNVLIVNHFFEGVDDPASEATINTRLVLTPCSQDLLRQAPGSAVVQYLVYNEFEQRFSTSRTVNCQQSLLLSAIDTTQEDRSIFSAGVSGTVTGQTRLTPIGDGLIGVAIEEHDEEVAAFNIHFQGDRAESDVIVLP